MRRKVYLKPESVAPLEAKRVLDFLNSAKNAEEIANTTDIPGEVDVGIGIANKILAARETVGRFTNLKQVDAIKGIGPERFTELVTALAGEPKKIADGSYPYLNSLLTEGYTPEIEGDDKPLLPEDIERALRILLRAIAWASIPQLTEAPAPGIGKVDEEVGGYPAVEITCREGCKCPCPDGISVDFLIEWDAPGFVNPDLFSDSLSRGKTKNPPGRGKGTTIELDDDKIVSLNFKNPKLGQLNTGDIIVTFNVKPFFSGGFDEDHCCITARGSFVGTAKITNYTNRGEANEQVARGQTNVNQAILVGKCNVEKGQKPCCTAIYRWNFAKKFTLKALGFDMESVVRGVITVELKVWEVGN